MLIAFQVLQGIAFALVTATSFAMIPSVFPPQERGQALGLTVASVYLGLSTGPFIGGLLTQYIHWRSIFVLATVLSALIAGLVFVKIKADWAEGGNRRFDLIGSIAYGIALMAITYGFSQLPGTTGLILLPIGIVFLLGFIVWESRVENPVLEVKLFRHNKLFTLSSLVALFSYAASYALPFLLSMNLQYVHKLSAQNAGMILLTMPVILVIVSPFAGRISDRVDPRHIAALGMGFTTVGLTLLALFGGENNLAFVIASLVICGLGFALFSSPNTNAIMGSVDKTYYGVASAVTGIMRLVGQMLSMSIATLLITLMVGNVEITPTYYPAFLTAFRLAFIVFAVLCFAGIIFSLLPGKAAVDAAVSSGPGERERSH
jgi:MFS family permease